MRLVNRAAPVAAALALVFPAAAAAATTVDPGFGGACAREGTCKTIQAAVTAAEANDVINVKAGGYAEDVTVPADKDGLTINGETGVAIEGSLTVAADDVKVNRLTLSRKSGAEGAINATGSGFLLEDSTLVSASGPGLDLAGSATVRRSVIATTLPTADGLRATSSAAPAKAIKVDSSIMLGGAGGAGLAVRTTGMSPGDVTLDVRHVTIPAVAKYGVLVDAAQAQVLLGAGVGNITTTITGSIVHGTAGSLARNYNGAALNIGANKVIVKYANSDASAMKDESQPLVGPVVSGDKNYGPNIDMGSPQLNTDAQLMDERFRLRAGSAAIDKGGAIVGDESATDIDGDPRTAGGATDIGADEFTNRAPVAKGVTLDPAQPKSGQPVTITGDATDPNVGDPLQFGFDFGDGSARVTSPTAAVQHVYARPGTYTLQFAAVDAAGLFSELITKSVTVIDGTPPSVAITGRKLLVKRHELRIRGTASDESGVASVEIALTRSAGCRQYTGRGFVRGGKGKACAASRKWIPVQLIGGKWEITTNPDVKLNKGKYVVRARGTDTAGSVGTRFSTKARTLVRVAVK